MENEAKSNTPVFDKQPIRMRLECLELALRMHPGEHPNAKSVVSAATEFEQYITGKDAK